MKQLEDILIYLLKNNNYTLATVIIKALHMPAAPEFQARMSEALRKTATKSDHKIDNHGHEKTCEKFRWSINRPIPTCPVLIRRQWRRFSISWQRRRTGRHAYSFST